MAGLIQKTELMGEEIPWLSTLRKQGLEAYQKQGFPGAKTEAWKYTKPRALNADDYVVNTGKKQTDFPSKEKIEGKADVFEPLPEGYGIYFDVTPEIKASTMDYKGTNLSFSPFSEKITTVLQIPVNKNHGLKSSVYSTVVEIPDRKNNQIIFRLMPLMKGLDDSFFSTPIEVRVKSILSDEGAFKLKIKKPENFSQDEVITVYVDGNLLENYDYTKLNPGMHHLSVISENFRQETRNFSIKKGETLEMEISLRDITPVVSFVAPEGARLYFDDIEITDTNKKELKTTPGPHKIKCIIGDFEITRVLDAEKGGVYSVSMLLNIDITKIE